MSFGIDNLGLYVAGTVLTIIVPGANTFRVLQGVKQHGFLGGMYASSGVMLADFVFMLAAAMGIGIIIHSNEFAHFGLLAIGGIYFLHLGISIIRSWRISISSSVNRFSATPRVPKKTSPELMIIFKSSFLTCIVNFKAIFFYGLFLPTFIDKNYSPSWVPIFTLCLICAVLLFCYYLCLSYIGLKIFNLKSGDKLFSIISLLFGFFITILSFRIFFEASTIFQKFSF